MKDSLARLALLPVKRLQQFMKIETASGIILFLMAIAALILTNSPWERHYQHLFYEVLLVDKSINFWINDGLMVLFFVVVGLEIKRELIAGELDTFQKRLMPSLSALGGVVVPAIIFIACNWHDPSALKGWAIPTATDIAFALGLLLLLGPRIPVSLKIFLMTLAIIDDLAAVIIISLFYTSHLSLIYLLLACLVILGLVILNKKHSTNLWCYALLGIMLWLCILGSGIHPTVAGVIFAFCIPLYAKEYSPLRTLEHYLHPWIAFGVMPIFAFANAGLSLAQLSLADLTEGLSLGIILGLFLGKPLGVVGASALAIKFKWGELPSNVTWQSFYGMSIICGVGFTMSLFIGNLAYQHFSNDYNTHVRLGVLCGSLLSGVVGYGMLRWQFKNMA